MKRIILDIYNTRIVKKNFSKMVFLLRGRPTVSPDRNELIDKKIGKGMLVLSADFELAWAFRYSKLTTTDPEQKAYQTRKNFDFLLGLFEKRRIPVTWATVGHLFLEKCTKGDHDWMRRIPYFDDHWKFDKGDWFDHDPYTHWQNAKAWYAPDLIRRIRDSGVKHEIGSHSFSHIDMSEKICPEGVADDELKACVDAAEKTGIKLKSFVFPGGRFGHKGLLKKHGFSSYRRRTKYEINHPYIDDTGLVVIPPTIGLADNGLGWSARYFKKRLIKYIDKAIRNRMMCHFWFHPSLDDWFLYNVFPALLEYADLRRKEGKLWTGTMDEVANLLLENKNGRTRNQI